MRLASRVAVILLAVSIVAASTLVSWHYQFYDGAAITTDASGDVTDDSGILSFAATADGQFSKYGFRSNGFRVVGVAGDPNAAAVTTADVTMGLYADADGTGGAVCTITFTQLTPSTTSDQEPFPGDCTALAATQFLPPYYQVNWVVDIDPNASDPNVFTFSIDIYGDFARDE